MDFKLLDLGRLRPGRLAVPPVFDGPSQVRAYWEALRIGGALPDRAQMDPRGLGGVLDRVFLAERIARGLVQVRIAGSGLAELAGMDLRGLPLSCLFTAEARPQLAETLEAVAQGQALAELDLAMDAGPGQVVARLLLLPLCDGADRRLVLGCLGTNGNLPTGKFRILSRQEERLELPVAPPAPQLVAQPPLRQRPHLTLVHARD
ncbi:MAG: PAS domain-containing protein [Rhodobacterales bacterium]|nr:PAS domain-containing protein [Rhodobacterales bacterium]